MGSVTVTWKRIRKPYLYGEVGIADTGDRIVELVRVENGLWSVYGTINKRHIKAGPAIPNRVSYAVAKRAARAILSGSTTPETW